MAEYAEVLRLKEAVERDLLNLPGVDGVGVGYLMKKGVKTDTLAIQIYVGDRKKVSLEMIPKKIDGVPTDIIYRRFKPLSHQKSLETSGEMKKNGKHRRNQKGQR